MNQLRSHLARWLALIALGAALLAEGLFRSGALQPIEQRLQDAWFQWQGKRAEARHVVIVAIDEATLEAFPDDPMVFWTDRLARASVRLREAGVTAIGFDMLLSISPERWLGKLGGDLQRAARDYDRPFREEVNGGRLVLVASRSGSGAQEADYLLPSPDYLLALPGFDIPGHIGLGDVLDEGDGVIRRFLVAPVAGTGVVPPESVPVLGLPSLLAVRAAGLDPHAAAWTLGGRKVSRGGTATPIPYLGPPGTFPRISLKELLGEGPLPGATSEMLRGNAVILGATAAGLNDEHFTPYATRFFSGRGGLMTGVEVHANIAEALLSGERLRPLSPWLRAVTLLILTGLAAAAFGALPAWQGALALLAAAPLLALASYLTFRAGVLAPAATYVLTAGLVLLGVLGWRLTGEERERARLRRLFGRYVSGQVVDALLDSGQRPELGGQSQTVTVLFSDIRNFTTISERLEAKEVVEMLNTYFERACAVLMAEGGSIDKFIGDAVMVEFGSPLPVADHAIRGVRAALALHAVAQEFAGWMAARFPGRDLPPFAVGIGLHSGEAVIGNIGSPTRMEFTAIGDTVNLASRLEGMTKQLGCAILASEQTIAAAGPAVRCGCSEVISVKGREAPVRVHEVLKVEEGESSDA
ncbi:MAG: adenylate/guanylate cyclase domain-containing protein [Rhodocyclaceae bacterium]|nr:adenylate/guanylate cyclase domain-containing protein [Rhodocyclaceae bacterium]